MGSNAETRITALLFSFSAAALLLLLARRDAIADLVLAALHRFLLDGRGLLDLATRRNMILLCHAILLLILRDAGVLGAPARRRGATATTAAAVAVADSEESCSAPPRPRANSVVVWQRPPNRAAAAHDAAVERQLPRGPPRPAEAVAPWAAVALAGQSPAEEPDTNKQIVLVEQAATNDLAGHDRAAAVELEQQAEAASVTGDGKESGFDSRIIVANDERNTEMEQAEEMSELADDRRIEEFIAKQWSKMRQESLQLHLVRSSLGSQQAAIPAY